MTSCGSSLMLAWTSAVVLLLLAVSSAQELQLRETKRIVGIDQKCQPGTLLVIAEAFIDHQSHPKYPCNSDCKLTSHFDPPSRCFSPAQNQCRTRFTYHHVNKIYKALDARSQQLLSKAERRMSQYGPFTIKYYCVDEATTINPCTHNWNEEPEGEFTSLLVRRQPCTKFCTLTFLNPVDSLEMSGNAIFSSYKNARIFYKYVLENNEKSQWQCPETQYQTNGQSQTDKKVKELKVYLSPGIRVALTWIYLNGKKFSLSCKGGDPSVPSRCTKCTCLPSADGFSCDSCELKENAVLSSTSCYPYADPPKFLRPHPECCFVEELCPGGAGYNQETANKYRDWLKDTTKPKPTLPTSN